MRAATSISLIIFAQSLERFASFAAFLCLVVAHFEWPAIEHPFIPLLTVNRAQVYASCTNTLLLAVGGKLRHYRRTAKTEKPHQRSQLQRQRIRNRIVIESPGEFYSGMCITEFSRYVATALRRLPDRLHQIPLSAKTQPKILRAEPKRLRFVSLLRELGKQRRNYSAAAIKSSLQRITGPIQTNMQSVKSLRSVKRPDSHDDNEDQRDDEKHDTKCHRSILTFSL